MGAEGASRESLCDSLRIKTGRSLSKRASSGSASFDPATSSPCEDWFGENSEGRRQEGGDLDLRFSVDYLLVWGRLDR